MNYGAGKECLLVIIFECWDLLAGGCVLTT